MTQTRYQVVSTIGVGATSRVDKAHDSLIDRTVALKTFGHGFGSDELQKQFVREAQILGRLSHPNIVSIYDIGTNEDGSAYLVMEFVPGKTLESVLAAKRPLPLSRVGVWAGDLANALNRAHRAGIIHGDVKPANIFVTDEGHIKLGDFGIARFATQLSGTGKLVGTPAYLSPEQIKGETQDHRSDIFSLGIILYQLATGVRPFDGSSVTAVCAQIVASEPAPPSQHNPELPKEFDRIVMRCLSKDPEKRYASGESLAASLYPFARSKPETVPRRFGFSWFKRPLNPADKWISVAICSAALVTMGLAVHFNPPKVKTASPADILALTLPPLDNTTPPLSLNASSDNAIQPISVESPRGDSASGSNPKEHHAAAHASHAKTLPTKRTPAKPLSPGTAGLPADLPLLADASNTRATSAASNAANHVAAVTQVPLNIEITSVIDKETLAVYADQQLVATSALFVTSAGEALHIERTLSPGPHEFRVVLYGPDQSLHLERGGLADLQSGSANLLSIKVVRHAKMLVKHDAALEILWPGAVPKPAKDSKDGVTVADASSPHSTR
jgi:serine/threonine protein kinase